MDDKTAILFDNYRVLEGLQAELIEAVATLFRANLKNDDVVIHDTLAAIVIMTYLIAKKHGLTGDMVNLTARSKLQTAMSDTLKSDQWFKDMEELYYFLEKKKR